MTDRVSTGIDGLDAILNGGFPRGSLILLAGNPGTGKTAFSMQFIVRGAELGETGVYVSFAEGRETLLENFSSHLGVDLASLEAEGKLRILDLVAMREDSMSAILGGILGEVEALGAKRLVIDSFSAMAQAYKEPIDVRVIIHTVLGKIVRQMNCTTVMIEEVPIGKAVVGAGIEEFMADGLIMLRVDKLDGRLLRDLEIIKLRGVEPGERELAFTLKDGFKALLPLKPKLTVKAESFQPIPDPPGRYSTGSEDLDLMLGGGLPKGSSTLLEVAEKTSTLEYQILIDPIAANFIAQGRGVLNIPPSGVDATNIVDRASSYGIEEDAINRFMRVCELFEPYSEQKPYTFTVKGRDINEDLEEFIRIVKELERTTGQPILAIVGLDTLTAIYGEEACIRTLSLGAIKSKMFGAAVIYLAKPGYEGLTEKFSSIADINLRLTREHGAPLLYGIKPRTGLYAVDIDTSRGYLLPKLTPIV